MRYINKRFTNSNVVFLTLSEIRIVAFTTFLSHKKCCMYEIYVK